jgi:hypothetical protein
MGESVEVGHGRGSKGVDTKHGIIRLMSGLFGLYTTHLLVGSDFLVFVLARSTSHFVFYAICLSFVSVPHGVPLHFSFHPIQRIVRNLFTHCPS